MPEANRRSGALADPVSSGQPTKAVHIFLFTDVVGSTRLWSRTRPKRLSISRPT